MNNKKRKLQQSLTSFFGSNNLVEKEIKEENESYKTSTFPSTKTDNLDLKNSSSCINNSSVDPNSNAFNILMNSAKLKALGPRVLYFNLIKKNDRLYPCIHSQNICSPCFWDCSVVLKDFKVDLESSSKESIQLILVTNILPSDIKDKSPQSNNQMKSSLLKSMMQKGVRRRLMSKVLKLSHILAELDLQELVRRVPIISVEDSVLHPGLPIIVWMMVALSKGYTPPPFVKLITILIAAEIAQTEFKDIPFYDPSKVKCEILENAPLNLKSEHSIVEDSFLSKILSNPEINQASNTLIASLLIRSSYGGMHFDRVMLEDYASIWFRRLNNHLVITENNSYPSSFGSLTSYLDRKYLVDIYQSGCLCSSCICQSCYNYHSASSSPKSILMPSWGMQLINAFIFIPQNDILDLHASCLHSLQATYLLDSSREAKTLTVPLQADLVPEGIDFHIDWNLIDHLYEVHGSDLVKKLKESSSSLQGLNIVENYSEETIKNFLKTLIWTFRSGVNNHKIWTLSVSEENTFRHQQSQELEKKQRLAMFWRIIASSISSYCSKKVQIICKQNKIFS